MDAEQLVDIINNINKSGTHLSNLLANLLQWSRTQTGKIEFNPDKVLLNNVVNDNINLIKLHADKKNINLCSSVAENLCVFADPNMTTTIMRNLITNAIKFSGLGGEVFISAEHIGDQVNISVRDNGIGLSPDDISKLFRIDVHNATIGSSKEKGTGLGLILCKEFVEINGGRIWVESTEGIGSNFSFSLPFYKGSLHKTPVTADSADSALLQA
jgi:signal transduction histidine kinase